MEDGTKALMEAGRAHTRIDGVQTAVQGLGDGLNDHRKENTDQHKNNLAAMDRGFSKVHGRVDDIHTLTRNIAFAVIGLLLSVLGYLLVQGRPWE